MKRQRRVIIIGSGVAGLYCAWRCAEHSQVTVITKNRLIAGSSPYAQGGIAAAMVAPDNFRNHLHDTLKAGAYHNKISATTILVKEAPLHIKALNELGVHFTVNRQGQFDLGREGGHSRRRIVHAADMTGAAVDAALLAAVKRNSHIALRPWEFALNLVKRRGRIVGVTTWQLKTKKQSFHSADAAVLATGGCGQVYPYTSNPAEVTGDGIAMAKQAGAKLADMEFMQFHPTAFYIPGKSPFLLSEALRGEGARLRNFAGQRFVNELLPRDQVSRAVYRQQRRGLVYLDFRHLSGARLRERFPGIYAHLLANGFRLERDLIPITPVAHYLCGGINTDVYGRTSLPGLYAIGETARTGVHGANRLASNSLLECLVFGFRAAAAIKQEKNRGGLSKISVKTPHQQFGKSNFSSRTSDTYIGLRQQLQNIMWEAGGIVRTEAGLRSGLAAMRVLKRTIAAELRREISVFALELYNMAEVSEQILQAALHRKTSLGCHYLAR